MVEIKEEINESIPLESLSDRDLIKRAWEEVVIHHREPSHPVRKLILNSWIQCQELGLDPLGKHSPSVISKKK